MMRKGRKQLICFCIFIFTMALISEGSFLQAHRERAGGYLSTEDRTYAARMISSTPPLSLTPQPEKICKEIDLTLFLEKKFPGNLVYLKKVDDLQKRYFIVELHDLATYYARWIIYDIGSDGTFSGDDRWYSPGSLADSYSFIGQIGVTLTGTEKLFWAVYLTISNSEGVVSCTLPHCTDAKVEFVLNSSRHVVALSPHPPTNRVFIMLTEREGNSIKSCSLNYLDQNYCGNSESSYRVHAVEALPQGRASVPNGGMIFSNRNKELWFLTPAEKALPLPQNAKLESIMLLAPTIPITFLVRSSFNSSNEELIELWMMDLATGTLNFIERLPPRAHYILLSTISNQKIMTFFKSVSSAHNTYARKVFGEQAKTIWNGSFDFHDAKLLQYGDIILLENSLQRIVSDRAILVDC